MNKKTFYGILIAAIITIALVGIDLLILSRSAPPTNTNIPDYLSCAQSSDCLNTCCGCTSNAKECGINCFVLIPRTCECVNNKCVEKITEEKTDTPACAKQGKYINYPAGINKNLPDVCCEGLKGLAAFIVNESGECEPILGGPFLTCMPCGNGICESDTIAENKCNCPEDCSQKNSKVSIATDKKEYERGEWVVISLNKQSATSIESPLAFPLIEKYQNEKWGKINAFLEYDCAHKEISPTAYYILNPKKEIVWDQRIKSCQNQDVEGDYLDAGIGRYRLSFTYQYRDENWKDHQENIVTEITIKEKQPMEKVNVAIIQFVPPNLKTEKIGDYDGFKDYSETVIDLLNNRKGYTDIFWSRANVVRMYSFHSIAKWFNDEHKRYTGADKDIINVTVKGPYALTQRPSQSILDLLQYLTPQSRNPQMQYEHEIVNQPVVDFFQEQIQKLRLDLNLKNYQIVAFIYYDDSQIPAIKSARQSGKPVLLRSSGSLAINNKSLILGYIPTELNLGYRDSNFAVTNTIHDLSHILGAADKDAHSINGNQNFKCSYPDGVADPYLRPLFPQEKGEIMCKSIQVERMASLETTNSVNLSYMLENISVGPRTAYELGWLNSVELEKIFPAGVDEKKLKK